MRIFYFLIIVFGAIGIWAYFDNKKKQKGSVVNISPGPGPFQRDVEKIIAQHGFDKKLNFELSGVHLKKVRKFFEKEAFEYLIVDLVPEPNNPNDKNAIAVHYMEQNIGYVERKATNGVSKLLNEGFVMCYILDIKWRYDENRNYEYLDVTLQIPFK